MSEADFENVSNQLTFENENNQCNQLDFIYKDFLKRQIKVHVF